MLAWLAPQRLSAIVPGGGGAEAGVIGGTGDGIDQCAFVDHGPAP